MKPIIGVMPLWDSTRDSIWMLPAYLELIREGGGLPVILPLGCESEDTLRLVAMCDGLLFTGGDDISPALYGEEACAECGEANPLRDELERVVFDYALAHDTPMLGICRGIQLFNALLGGTLYQDLPSQRGVVGGVSHAMTPPYDSEVHRVRVVEDTPLWSVVGCDEMGVNSYHHQAIKDLSPSLTPMAYSEDGLVEAVYLPTHRFMQAYQWHPELNFRVDKHSCNIVSRFIEAAIE